MIESIKGDIFKLWDQKEVQGIAHGVNSKGAMGAGVAREVRRRWPGLYLQYLELCHGPDAFPDCFPWNDPETDMWVYNLHTQIHPGPNATLDLIRKAVSAMDQHARQLNLNSIAMPWIGSGIGGLDWADVLMLLDQELDVSPVTYYLVEWQK